jgi:hypothetical protein
MVMLLYFCVPLLSTQCGDYAAAACYCEASVQRVCKRFGATSIEAGPEYAKLAQLHHLNGQVRDGGLSSSPATATAHHTGEWFVQASSARAAAKLGLQCLRPVQESHSKDILALKALM